MNRSRARTPRAAAGARRLLRASIAPFLLLITPFVVFIHYQGYGFARPDVILVALALAGLALLLGAGATVWAPFETVTLAALLVLFMDIQIEDPSEKLLGLMFIALIAGLWALREHAAQIVSLGMGTVLAFSLLPPRAHAALPEEPQAHRDLPLVVHLILDEHIGVEGLPPDLTPHAFKQDLQAFFVERGFHLFGGAYSEHPSTLPSLSHLLNLVAGSSVPQLTSLATPRSFQLTRNEYFERLAAAGYGIRVHQTDYLNLCTKPVPASACHTYSATSLRALDGIAASAPEKVSVVAGTFMARSDAVARAKSVYRMARRGLVKANLELPAWTWDRSGAAPAAAMGAFDAVAADLAASGRGDVVFAHLLMPHYPYVYDEECRSRPPSQWLSRSDANMVHAVDGMTNTRESRASRYALYLAQMVCARRKVEQLIAAIPPPLRGDAIVIVQGDHGSRIALADPDGDAEASLTVADYADHFSTLFAVRAPQIPAGYDSRPTSTTCLVRTLLASGFRSTAGADACAPEPVVFFHDSKKPHVLPDFAARHAMRSAAP